MLQSFLGVAQTAERAKFDMLFLADGIGVRLDDKPKGSLCRSHHNVELEPLTLLSALATLTQNIGLVATASTTYNEPFHIARNMARWTGSAADARLGTSGPLGRTRKRGVSR